MKFEMGGKFNISRSIEFPDQFLYNTSTRHISRMLFFSRWIAKLNFPKTQIISIEYICKTNSSYQISCSSNSLCKFSVIHGTLNIHHFPKFCHDCNSSTIFRKKTNILGRPFCLFVETGCFLAWRSRAHSQQLTQITGLGGSLFQVPLHLFQAVSVVSVDFA